MIQNIADNQDADRGQDEYMTCREVASKCRVDGQTVRRWIREKKVQAFKTGGDHGRWRIHSGSLDEFLAGADASG